MVEVTTVTSTRWKIHLLSLKVYHSHLRCHHIFMLHGWSWELFIDSIRHIHFVYPASIVARTRKVMNGKFCLAFLSSLNFFFHLAFFFPDRVILCVLFRWEPFSFTSGNFQIIVRWRWLRFFASTWLKKRDPQCRAFELVSRIVKFNGNDEGFLDFPCKFYCVIFLLLKTHHRSLRTWKIEFMMCTTQTRYMNNPSGLHPEEHNNKRNRNRKLHTYIEAHYNCRSRWWRLSAFIECRTVKIMRLSRLRSIRREICTRNLWRNLNTNCMHF